MIQYCPLLALWFVALRLGHEFGHAGWLMLATPFQGRAIPFHFTDLAPEQALGLYQQRIKINEGLRTDV